MSALEIIDMVIKKEGIDLESLSYEERSDVRELYASKIMNRIDEYLFGGCSFR